MMPPRGLAWLITPPAPPLASSETLKQTGHHDLQTLPPLVPLPPLLHQSNANTLTPFRTQENDQPIEKPIFPSQPSQIYVNNSYSREYVNELKVTMIKK